MRRNRRLNFPPVVYWTFALVESFILQNWWVKGQRGSDAHAVAAVIIALHMMRQVFLGFRARDQRMDLKKIADGLMETSGNHGSARWATEADIKKAGMHKKGGLFIGRHDKTMLYHNGPGGLITVAPPRSGKGVSLIIPNLLTYEKSMVVLDPKAELYFTTARHREEKMGNRVIALCPWADQMSEEFGIPIVDQPFNPLCFLKAGPDLKDDCAMVAALLIQSKPEARDEDEFWLKSGREILTATMMHELSKNGKITLPRLREILFMSPDDTARLFREMIENKDCGGAISEYGKKFASTLIGASKQWIGQLATAQNAVEIYARGSQLGQHVAGGEINWSALKETPTTIYIILPGERIASHSAWLNLLLALSIKLLARNRSDIRVPFLCDEAGNLRVLDTLLREMALTGGLGIQLWLFFQAMSQIEAVTGKSGLHTFLASAEVFMAFDVNDQKTAVELSAWAGNRTVKGISQTANTDEVTGNSKISENYSETGQPLFRAEDVRVSNSNIIFCRKLPPIRAEKVNYYEHPEWRNLADPNPYVTFEYL